MDEKLKQLEDKLAANQQSLRDKGLDITSMTSDQFQAIFKGIGSRCSTKEVSALFEKAKNQHGRVNFRKFLQKLNKGLLGGGKHLQNAAIGVIRLDYDYPAAPGDIDHPDSFSYDVVYRVIPGLTFAMCQSGRMTPEVEDEFIAGIDFLVNEGVCGITGDCGFMMWFQKMARRNTNIPVFMSSLAQLPAITCAYGMNEQIAIFTANGKTLEPMKGLIRDECGLDVDDPHRYVIVGCQDVPGFEAVDKGEHVDYAKTEPGIVAKAKQTLRENPSVRAILMECTELPQFSDAVRNETGLPVYDAITSCDGFMAAFQDNVRFGRPAFRKDEDLQEEAYTYGSNLTPAQKAKLINKVTKGPQRRHPGYVKPETHAATSKMKPATLGVIRLDYDYPAAPGDIDHPDSFVYDVIYRVIPGLTFHMCQSGRLSPDVEQELRDGVRYLEGRGVSGITGDCGFMMYLQPVVRDLTKIPVFMSSLAQLPAVTCSFAHNEKIAIFTANGKTLEPMKDLIRKECGVDVNEKRYIIVGCQDVTGFDAVDRGDHVDYLKTEPGMVQKAREVMQENPGIRGFLFECTELPQFSDSVRAETGLPVWDAITSCDSFVTAFQDNVRFGRALIQKNPSVLKEAYCYGSNLTEAQKAKLVNKVKPPDPRKPVSKANQLRQATLGVIRLDYEYPPAPGDIDHPESFCYDVIYRVVPGLTFHMCQSGAMPQDVEKEFLDAIDFLVQKGVSGITGDCGFMMYFQPLARRYTTIPIFMSSLAQLPAVTCAFGRQELIAIFTANGKTLAPMSQLIRDECGVDMGERRFIIVGCEDVPGFEAVDKGEKVNYAKTEPGMVVKAKQCVKDYPQLRGFLFECTELPQFSDAVRHETGLPVFDAITSCDCFMASFQDNVRFGRSNFRKDTALLKEAYEYGANLTPAQKLKLVNKG